MKQFNVLVADPISKDGIKALLDHEQFNVDIQTGLSEEALIKIIPSYHALIVRSQTTVTENIINAADSLKVIARAGVGVDNINIDADFFAKAKPSLQIINVARGGIIDEKALIKALDEGQISRAAIDVFEHEPATDSPLVAHDKIIVTPHLGASTVEAQEKVAISVSNEIIEILIDGTVTHAVNAPKMDLSNIDDTVKSFINLSQTVGELAIQLMYNAPSSIKITYGGDLASIDSSLLTRTIITHILKDDLGPEVNIINALMLLNQQQVTLNIENNKAETGFSNYLEVELSNDSDSVKVGASVFTGFGPRIVRINNFSVDLKPNQYQIVSYHNDTPGMVGKTGALLGKYNINIASMTLGRTEAGGDALMILSVDQPVSNNIIDELKQVGEYNQIFTTELTVQS
ncbi:TPA: phosphoglycerate dehydrogenase [Staphylococcus aureus]|nr:phosphoglycerate dehydrogenase [Staphylococcus aureus]